jgi:hypothetical protein
MLSGFHFELISDGVIVAKLDFDTGEKFIGGGWIVE